MKIHNKRELQELSTNHSADIDYKEDIQKVYKKPCSFLTTDTTLPADNHLRFRKSLLDSLEK